MFRDQSKFYYKIINFYIPKTVEEQKNFLDDHVILYGDLKTNKRFSRYTVAIDLIRQNLIAFNAVFWRDSPLY